MKLRSQESFIMRSRMQRDIFSWTAKKRRSIKCVPAKRSCEKMSLCVLRGSLSAEAALIMPFFLTILLTFFSFFIQYASAAELKIKAAAEAKKAAFTLGYVQRPEAEEITIYRSKTIEPYRVVPLLKEYKITEKAICRAWIGFTELEAVQTAVYLTPEGEVYHLYNDCTHLKLSVRPVVYEKVENLKNDDGQRYRACAICGDEEKMLVYITSEGDCYHSNRTCSGLKRTIRSVSMDQVDGRSCCMRCLSRGEAS